ncbi:hypothetical protein M6B38_190035 [Iris pallida]|uniref:Uncharacterized protein n=1 Tax=Iris pallida TaxID=29817 RepID=A0AAX6EFX5_IRIPA|nr:hypothetical protein M6B38_190035 [Iris pallida]
MNAACGQQASPADLLSSAPGCRNRSAGPPPDLVDANVVHSAWMFCRAWPELSPCKLLSSSRFPFLLTLSLPFLFLLSFLRE